MMKFEDYNANYRKYVDFIEKYRKPSNAASASEVDANANVETKNIATCQEELCKREKIGANRLLMIDKLTQMYGEDMAREYIRQLESHEIYKHDETNIAPYTYGAHEIVNVRYVGKTYTIPMWRLYSLCEDDEELLDEDKDVWAKYPVDMFVEDRDGFTKIQRLIRKKRHRDLVRVKTAFSNDIIVTDNHPIIVEDDIDKTIPASESLGYKQYRCSSKMKFGGQTEIDSREVFKAGHMNFIEYDDCFVMQTSTKNTWYAVPKKVKLDRNFGYLVGFFIGDGNFSLYSSDICVTQAKDDVLKKIGNIIYTHLNGAARIQYNISDEKYQLITPNPFMFVLLKNVFNIGHLAMNKSMPENIFDYNEDFAKGIIEGLIDSDGSIDGGGCYSIRTSSRTLTMQIATVVNAFGITSGCGVQQTKFGCNEKIQQKYQLFGVRFREKGEPFTFGMAEKSKKARRIEKGQKNSFDEWQTITNVEPIDNEPYLDMNDYIYDITTESHSFVCNGFWVHNCVSITMYPFLFDGMTKIGGISTAPTNLDSFCGAFINLVFAVSSQFAGAVATPEFLMYMDYFLRKDYGDDYYLRADEIVTMPSVKRQRTIRDVVHDKASQVVYSINQPAAARGFQAAFWNIAYFDEPYFKGLFETFIFPDGSTPCWESLEWLQREFMNWLNEERRKAVITFPVETMNLLSDGMKYVDENSADFTAEMYARGHSFFTYTSDSVDSLASCCRLRNELQDNTFSYTLGAGGVSTGSKGVITMNINRLVQNAMKNRRNISDVVAEQVEKVHKYLIAYNEIVKDNLNARLLPVYDAGFISMEKQFLTASINGVVEGAQFLGIDISPNDKFFEYLESVLKPIYEINRRDRTDEVMFNCEMAPSENLAVKNAKWDKVDGYFVPRDCYNSYFYLVEDESCNVADKFILQGKKSTKYLDGGAANHVNLAEHLTKEQYRRILDYAIKTGCSYFTFNIPNTVCNDCGHISKHMLDRCPACGSENLDYATRVIGYLKRISRFSEARQREAAKRFYDGQVNI